MRSVFSKPPLFTRELVGDITFDREADNNRARLFKKGNIKQVVLYGDKRKDTAVNPLSHKLNSVYATTISRHGDSGREHAPAPSDDLTLLPSKGAYGAVHALESSKLHSKLLTEIDVSERPALQKKMASVARLLPDHEVVLKDSEVVTSTALFSYQSKRQSVRRQSHKVHEQQHATLNFDLLHIRKKLNFKETLHTVDNTPPKDSRCERIQCQCHLAIWDNREGFVSVEPIFKRSNMCHLTVRDPSAKDRLVHVELESPFDVKANELRVPLARGGTTQTIIGDNYFLEIKIVPAVAVAKWPPFPILSKTEGELYQAHSAASTRSVQGALVARYHHLPLAPASDVPLSLWYVDDGTLYRTKYGLAVHALWSNRTPLEQEVHERRSATWSAASSWLSTSETKASETVGGRAPQRTPSHGKVTVSYIFDGVEHTSNNASLRTATLRGFACPICRSMEAVTWVELQVHFLTTHWKFDFHVSKETTDGAGNIRAATINVSHAVPPRQKDLNRPKNPKEMNYVAADAPFHVEKYLQERRTTAKTPIKKATASPLVDPRTLLRQKHGGCLPVEHVAEIPPPDRRRFPVVATRTKSNLPLFTSVSHRQLRLSEEAHSESDDDMDTEWIKGKQAQRIDNRADLADGAKEFQKRWNRHRMDEGLPPSRYLSDSLVRFVRKHRIWLSGVEASANLSTLMQRFQNRRLVTDEVVDGCCKIVSEAAEAVAAEAVAASNPKPTSSHDIFCESPRAGIPASPVAAEPSAINERRVTASSTPSDPHVPPADQVPSQDKELPVVAPKNREHRPDLVPDTSLPRADIVTVDPPRPDPAKQPPAPLLTPAHQAKSNAPVRHDDSDSDSDSDSDLEEIDQSKFVANTRKSDTSKRNPAVSSTPSVASPPRSTPQDRARNGRFGKKRKTPPGDSVLERVSLDLSHHPFSRTTSPSARKRHRVHLPRPTVCGLCECPVHSIDLTALTCRRQSPPTASITSSGRTCQAPIYSYHESCVRSTSRWPGNTHVNDWVCPPCYHRYDRDGRKADESHIALHVLDEVRSLAGRVMAKLDRRIRSECVDLRD